MQTFKIAQNQAQILEAQRVQATQAFLNTQSTQIQPNLKNKRQNPQMQTQQPRAIQPNSQAQNTQPMRSSASLNTAMMRANVSQKIFRIYKLDKFEIHNKPFNKMFHQ